MGISVESFKGQIQMLSEDKRIEIVPFSSSEYHSLWNRNDEKLKIAITFDDGYKDNLYIAAPILLKYSVPFAFFVTAKFIQANSDIYLSKKELSEISVLPGVTIGSHGMTHRRLTQLDDGDLRAELVESRSRIEDMIGMKVDTLSYPHGKLDKRVRDIAFESGYRLGARSRFGINGVDSDPMVLNRTEIWATDSECVFQQKCAGFWDWYGHYQKLKGI
jgi:peptidoglycan/xylan/chitin deacetylase (PgdA/CDA1 family)